jgi:LysM repeat protein
MKQIVLALAALLSFQILPAQNVSYVLFNRDCMNQLEYRYSYPNLKGENSVWAYSIKPNVQENFIFMTKGAGHYSPELPAGTVSCRDLNLDDAFVASVNRGAEQMLIVFQRQSGGYWLMPVESATFVARSGSNYWVRGHQSSFQFDTLRLVNEQNLAVAGSLTAAYFSGAKLSNCLMEYSFHCEPMKTGQTRSDFQIIPTIGVVNDRTGNSASQAMENELQLVRVNGKTLEEYITGACPEGSGKIAISKSQKMAGYGNRLEPDKEIASIMQNEQVAPPATPTPSLNAKGIACAESWEPGTHIVQKGENLRAIARTYKVSEQQLIKWNNIQNPNLIEICQKIWLKQPTTSTSKGVAAQMYSTEQQTGKTVQAQSLAAPKVVDPNRPVTYSDGASGNTTYNVSPETTSKGSGPRIHTVHRGDYLYKIAKMYSCPEECIRIANAMPIEGDEPLSIGQEIIIPECTCTVEGKVIKKSPAPETVQPAAPVVKKQGLVAEQQPVSAVKKPKVSILDETDISPIQYSNETANPAPVTTKPSNLWEETSLYNDESAKVSQSKPAGANARKNETAKVPLFKEHLVRQGENLNSIATKYRVDASELSQVNGLDPKESLIPGKLVLVPILGN